jgi:heme-degrading monooxygenase HmoA
MRSLFRQIALLSLALATCGPVIAQKQHSQITQSKKTGNMQQVLIDKITVPANAKDAFAERMNINRNIIRQQPGFVSDEVFEQKDENGNLVVVTVARWQNTELLSKARQTVQAEYARSGFNLQEFCQKLNIKIERGIYQPLNN